jgi:hypothetical protein
MAKLKLVEVTWVDSYTQHGWKPTTDFLEDQGFDCKSVGYLIQKSAEWVQLIQTQGPNDKLADSITIPRACVKKIRSLG